MKERRVGGGNVRGSPRVVSLVAVFLYVPGFYFLCDGEINENDRKDREAVGPGRRHKAKKSSPGRESNGKGGPNDKD